MIEKIQDASPIITKTFPVVRGTTVGRITFSRAFALLASRVPP